MSHSVPVGVGTGLPVRGGVVAAVVTCLALILLIEVIAGRSADHGSNRAAYECTACAVVGGVPE